MNKWTEKLLKTDLDGALSYYKIDGNPLGERKLWLQDDYVKFIRFAHWKIQKAGFGIVGIITNNSFLDNPTYRGMRQSLMNTFNEIYILNLHGSSKKAETTPDGGKDENVFDITQGVAITLFVKQENKKDCIVYYSDLYGLREQKYEWLKYNTVETCKYQTYTPNSHWYFFTPKNMEGIKEYLKLPSIKDIFILENVSGVVTARDKLAIDINKESLKSKIKIFRNLNYSDNDLKTILKIKDNYQWKINEQRNELRKINDWENYFQQILYRPFDLRHIYYQENIVFRQRKHIMQHFLNKLNIGIATVRQVKTGKSWQHCLISDKMIESCYISNKTSEINYLFPLYLYNEQNTNDLYSHNNNENKRESNISDKFINLLTQKYKHTISPETIFYYIYAILYSNIYRVHYLEFLKIDFPRIPFTSNYELFINFSHLGERLANIHLLKSIELDTPKVRFMGNSINTKIEKIFYDKDSNRVYINNEMYFQDITQEMWEYHIGAYQVLDKFLKDRKGNIMDDPRHFCRMATAIYLTIELQSEIDDLEPQIELDILAL